MPETPLIRCIGLTKYFGGVLALNRVSLEFNPGEIVCLVGDNGAGKSTFVKMLSGLHQRRSLEVAILEQPLIRLDDFERVGTGDQNLAEKLIGVKGERGDETF